MLYAFRVARSQPHPLLPSPFPSSFGRKTTRVRFQQAKTKSTIPENQENMDKTQNQNEKTSDVMSQSFGEAYSTRCDEEGFGGIYGGNQSIPKPDEDKVIQENHPADYDKRQGSEVKEKEKGRNQTNI